MADGNLDGDGADGAALPGKQRMKMNEDKYKVKDGRVM
jgi:hypothetical protein